MTHSSVTPRSGVASVLGVVLVLTLSFAVAACVADGPTGDSSADRGEQVYANSCATCHGADLRGTQVGPPLLSELYRPEVHSDQALRASITSGVDEVNWNFGPMPAVGAVRGSDLDAVVAFVRERQRDEALEPFPPAD